MALYLRARRRRTRARDRVDLCVELFYNKYKEREKGKNPDLKTQVQRTLLEERPRSTGAAQSKSNYARTKGHHRSNNRDCGHLYEAPSGPTRTTLPRAAARFNKTRTSNSNHQTRAYTWRSASTEAYRPTPPTADCTARQLPNPRPLHGREHHPQPSADCCRRPPSPSPSPKKAATQVRHASELDQPPQYLHLHSFNIHHRHQQQRSDRRARGGGWYYLELGCAASGGSSDRRLNSASTASARRRTECRCSENPAMHRAASPPRSASRRSLSDCLSPLV